MSTHSNNDPAKVILGFLEDLVRIPTVYPPGNTQAISAYLHATLAALGYATKTYAAAPGLDNVIARMGAGRPSLVFNAHVDTVGTGDPTLWTHPPLELSVKNGYCFGLGAANCKGSAAVQLWLAAELARRGGPRRGEVVFTFVTDEESLGQHGMYALREQGLIRPDMLLLGAPTANAVINAERGVLWAQVTTTGRPAHAGAPERGDNAIARMMRVLQHLTARMEVLLKDRTDGDMCSTFNIGQINGGTNTNVVPARCSVQIDRRLLPGESVEEAFAEIESIVRSAGEPRAAVCVEQLRGTDGFRSIAAELVESLCAAITTVTGDPASFASAIGVSDGRYFAADGIEIVNFGPGEGSEGHASNESVSIDSLRSSAMILERMVGALMGYRDEPGHLPRD
ncbi:ArgE/DapE family deacylase [Povalibacter sp.]|uniref:M20 family metallopeptidase n=1 Tax=Povalibacter sp. TaxID=1962978 RepID=UPI002F429968